MNDTVPQTVIAYGIYLGIAIPLTIWVARTLHKSGRIFLVDCFHGNEQLADSVNHLLVVGFYLVNIGFVALYMKLDLDVLDLVAAPAETTRLSHRRSFVHSSSVRFVLSHLQTPRS